MKKFVCSNCGFEGKPKKYAKGLLAARYKACPKCKTQIMIPEITPKGQKLSNETTGELLSNLIQSTNPCPDCIKASELEPMTLQDWESHPLGAPDKGKRKCKDYCLCLLITEDTELYSLDDDLLRGDKGTDEYPLELRCGELSEMWREKFGDMPGRFLKMTVEESISVMEKELGIK